MRSSSLCMNLRSGYHGREDIPPCRDVMFNKILGLLDTNWPFFAWRVEVDKSEVSSKQDVCRRDSISQFIARRWEQRKKEAGHVSEQKLVDGFLLIAWNLADSVKAHVRKAEDQMKSLAYSTIEDDQERFTRLIGFRNRVGTCYSMLEISRLVVETFLEKSALEQSFVTPIGELAGLTIARSDVDSGLDRRWRESMKQPIRDYLEELEDKLDAIKEDLNEEITVAVGTVQVRDAQIMKEQTQVTARQTTWTVALTVLAAVYLPMTLVTGIFGMNITEIISEATAPNALWGFGACVVIVVLTVGGIVLYAVISKLRSRKKRSDLEADAGNEEGSGKVLAWLSRDGDRR